MKTSKGQECTQENKKVLPKPRICSVTSGAFCAMFRPVSSATDNRIDSSLVLGCQPTDLTVNNLPDLAMPREGSHRRAARYTMISRIGASGFFFRV